MLSKNRCPHTGVVNFFTHADPLLSVGSIAESNTSAHYVWRCYVGEGGGGLARDMPSAEAQIRSAVAVDDVRRRGKRARRAPAPALPSRASSYWQKLNEAAAARSTRTSTQ